MQLFGGDWTEQKLAVLKEYLCAYTTALKKQPFRTVYVDAFAGTGYREVKDKGNDEAMIFEDLAEDEPQEFLDGSAQIALNVKPAFSAYAFVERSRKRVLELEKIKEHFPDRSDCICIKHSDANEYIQEWCAEMDWKSWRAVLFLDPFGMQVDWDTMKAVAETGTIDLWALFPVSAVNRLLVKDCDQLPDTWKIRLNRIFGSEEWRDVFYEEKRQGVFPWAQGEVGKRGSLGIIAAHYQKRLASIFPNVADNPRTLTNSRNTPLFTLHFAAANPGQGGKIAIRIAQHILKEM